MAQDKATPSYFLANFLSRPATSIPKGAQWAVIFDDLNLILPTIQEAYKREPSSNMWKVEQAAQAVLNESIQKAKGCLFCQAIGLPGEGMTAVVEGNIKYNAFIRSYVGGGRNDFPMMRMSFLDTNVSFCDSFLRGWALATATFGMIARSDKKYRTNLTCWKFGITSKGPTVLQKMIFRDICCINVNEEEYNYDVPSSYVRREAQFVYTDYALDTDTSNDILSNK